MLGSSGSPLASGDLIRSCATKTAGRVIVAAGWTRDWLGRDCIRHTRPQAAMPAHRRTAAASGAGTASHRRRQGSACARRCGEEFHDHIREYDPGQQRELKSLLSSVVLAVMTWGVNTWEASPACRCHEDSDRAQIAIFEWSPGRTDPVRFTHGGGTAPRHPRWPARHPRRQRALKLRSEPLRGTGRRRLQ